MIALVADAHYCAALLKMVRSFLLHHKDEGVVMVSLDDKHKINLGEPDMPISVGARAHHRGMAAAAAAQPLLASDHGVDIFYLLS